MNRSEKYTPADLGQAVAQMTIQAQSLGMSARQFRASDGAATATEFDMPGHWQVTSMTAFGRLPDNVAMQTPIEPDGGQPRRRRSMSEINWLASARG